MNRASWVVAIAALSAAIAGISLATNSHLSNSTQSSIAQSTPSPTVSPSSTPSISSSPQLSLASKLERNQASRRPIVLRDQTNRNPEFAKFRRQLEQAIQKRDAQFVAALIPSSGVAQGFGTPRTIAELNLSNRNADFWKVLEKAMGSTCGLTDDGYVCPTVSSDFARQYPAPPNSKGVSYEISQVIVVGEKVNVRSQPNLKSSVVAVLTDEVVKLDQSIADQQAEVRIQKKQNYDPIQGWTPVILPDGQRGYVYNRYAYQPLEYRLVFKQHNGQWKLVSVPGGD